MRPLSFDHGAFNDQMIDLAVIVSSLPFVLEIGIGASGDCAMCGKIVALV
jgi:hypothetical protein